MGGYWMDAFERVLVAIGLRPDVRVVEQSDGIVLLSAGAFQIAIPASGRSRLYKRGIPHRVQKLMRAYSIGGLIPVSRGDLIVNVGANVGELAIGLSEIGCRVVAVEPDPLTLRCLRRNAGPSVDIIPKGLWNTDGDLTFYQKPNSADSSAINVVGEPIIIPACRLDTLMSGYDGRVRLIVGDAEGAEPEVLEGATDTLKRTDFVSLDVGKERDGETTADACKAILERNGFEILRIDDHPHIIARSRHR